MWHFYIPIAKYQKEKVKQSQLLSHFKKSSIHETGHPKLVYWDNPEGWDGEGGGREGLGGATHVHLWLIHVNVWPKPPQYCKIISPKLK